MQGRVTERTCRCSSSSPLLLRGQATPPTPTPPRPFCPPLLHARALCPLHPQAVAFIVADARGGRQVPTVRVNYDILPIVVQVRPGAISLSLSLFPTGQIILLNSKNVYNHFKDS